MCGICGIVNHKNNLTSDVDILKAMTDTLKDRGPDSYGYFIDNKVLLGHRRLIVVDPKGGSQPMTKFYNGKKYTIVYNGELYNTEDIRKELISLGYTFDAYSDTEVLLTSYIHWGKSCTEHLNGIYAFGVWDEKEESLFLVRDPLGVKPLFYAKRGNNLIFGSEIKTILAHPMVDAVINKDGLTELFALGPATAPGSAIFKNIFEVPPAHYLYVSQNKFQLKEYWKLKAEEFNESLDDATDHLRDLLVDAVERQLVGDVPLCTLLSGGLDSSAISAIASKKFKEKGKILDTYSIDYIDNDKFFTKSVFQPNSDEFYAREMVKFLGTNHHSVVLDNSELASYLDKAVFARDIPGMADVESSLYLFCKDIKKDFVVSLSGECADELFGGYPWYTRPELVNANTFPWSRFVSDRRTILSSNLKALDIEGCIDHHYTDSLKKVPHLPGESQEEFRQRELFYLNLKWFMVNLLNRKDRMSMANSLEVRVPFADLRLVEYAFNIPKDIKFADGREKGLLRRCLIGILPEKIIYRKKSPYPKTHNPLYTDLVSSRMMGILNDKNSPILQLIDEKEVRNIVESKGSSYKTPWYGQLMTGPQLIAYLIQVNTWLKEYDIDLEL